MTVKWPQIPSNKLDISNLPQFPTSPHKETPISQLALS